jgi:hypothetical protein
METEEDRDLAAAVELVRMMARCVPLSERLSRMLDQHAGPGIGPRELGLACLMLGVVTLKGEGVPQGALGGIAEMIWAAASAAKEPTNAA